MRISAALEVGTTDPREDAPDGVGQPLVLAFFGVVASWSVYLMPEYLGRNTGMMFEAMFAASGPVAMLVWLKEFGADPRLLTTICAVGIMKDRCIVFLTVPRSGFRGQGALRWFDCDVHRRTDGRCRDPWLLLLHRRLANAVTVHEVDARRHGDHYHSVFLVLLQGNVGT